MENMEIKTKIMKWINEDKVAKFRAVDVPNYDPEKYPYLLKIEAPKLGDTHIFKPRDYEDKIAVYTGIDITGDYKVAFDALNDQFKERLLLEVSSGITLMNLVLKFYPHHLDLKKILYQDMIYLDGLTKDRIMNSLTKVLSAYGYVITVLQRNNVIRKKFDPSEFT